MSKPDYVSGQDGAWSHHPTPPKYATDSSLIQLV